MSNNRGQDKFFTVGFGLQSAAKVTNIILEIHGTIFLIINFGRYSN
jgi:hypothetical protein